MQTRIFLRLYPCLLFILLFGLQFWNLSAEEIREGQEIQWAPIQGANGYIIEVQNQSGLLIERKSTNVPTLHLKLSPGKYSFRILALNKFRKVGKAYPWKELIVKPVESPVVKESPKVYNPQISGPSFTAKGLYLHRGTRVSLRDKKGNLYPAQVEVLRDGSGIIVTPPSNLPEGELEVVYQNSRGKPFRDELYVELETISPKLREKPSSSESFESPSLSSQKEVSDSKVLSMFWRQALVPGWGHYYGGYKSTGAFYFFGTLGLAGAVAGSYRSFEVARSGYSEIGILTAVLLPAVSQESLTGRLYRLTTLESSYTSANAKRNQTIAAQAALGGFYVLSLIHVLITGFTEEPSKEGTSFLLESYPEIQGNAQGTIVRTGIEFHF